MKDEYTYRVDYIAEDITKDIRTEISNRIREAVNSNQECFIAHWLLQNPDADLSKIRLCHGFKGNCYTFWIEENSDENF